ncbi:hypothetical protein V6N13_052547 [Hibiscus sabdariffa]
MWNVGDGKSVDFWRDHWIQGTGPLINYVSNRHANSLTPILVADMVDAAGSWHWSRLENMLPHSILLRLAAIKPSLLSVPGDGFGWRWTESTGFSG